MLHQICTLAKLTPVLEKNCASVIFWITAWNISRLYITEKLDINDYSFAHLTLILLLHYLVKCRSRSLAVYNMNSSLPARKIIVGPQNHWKSVTYLTLIRSESTQRTKIPDVDELKRRINCKCAALSHTVIECVLGQWRQRLRACVRSGGGHLIWAHAVIKMMWYDRRVTFLRDNNCQLCLS